MRKFLSIFLLLAMLTSLISCDMDFFFNPPSSGDTTADADGDSGNSHTPARPGDNDDDTSVKDDNNNIPDDTTPDDTTTPDDSSSVADYSYAPYMPTQMPRIDIATADGTNNFALSINSIDQKWNNLIEYVDCTVNISNCEEEYELSAASKIKVRGNYTITFPKQPFRLKFDSKQSLLGMNNYGKYKSWVLLADWKDSSMLMNPTAFYLGNAILGSDGYYCTDYRMVELYLNGTYWGVYLLVEQQQVDEGRVDIAEPEEGYTGTDIGYFFEYDGYYDKEDPTNGGDYTFTIDYNATSAPLKEASGATASSAFYRGYTIKSDTYSDAQRSFIKRYVEGAFKAVSESVVNGKTYSLTSDGVPYLEPGRNAEEAIRSIIDVQSLVDTYILNEICCDYDLHWSSFYMSVDMSATGNKKITFCAPWDFDTAFGAKDSSRFSNTISNPTKYSGKDSCENADTLYAANNRNPWLLLLVNEEWFMKEVEDKWSELVDNGVLQKALNQITDFTNTYETQLIANATRKWDEKYTGQYSPLGYTYQVGDPCPNNFKELVSAIAECETQRDAAERLSDWLTKRFNFLNREWGDGSNLFS